MNNAFRLLVDWAENQGYWGKVLLKVTLEKGCVSDEDLNSIIENYKSSNLEFECKFTEPEEKKEKIFLTKLENVKGVNKLAPFQRLEFGKNLTVAYGYNGSGKTGYSRILKQMGISLDTSAIIYPNIHEEHPQEMSALVSFKTENEEEKNIIWSEKTKKNLNLKTFNSSCVTFSLNNEKKLQFQPSEFSTIQIIKDATLKLCSKAKTEIENAKKAISAVGIILGTKANKLLSDIAENINANFNKNIDDFLLENGDNIDKVKEELKVTQNDRETINTEAIRKTIESLIAYKIFLNKIKTYIYINSEVNKKFTDTYIDKSLEIIKLQREQIDINNILKTEFDNNQKKALQDFLNEANKFYFSVSKNGFDKMKECIFCKQPILSYETKQLLSSYETFIKIDNSQKIKELQKAIVNDKTKLNNFIEKIDVYLEQLDESEFKKEFIKIKENFVAFRDYDFNNSYPCFEKNNLVDLENFKLILTEEERLNEENYKKELTKQGKISKCIDENIIKQNELNSIIRFLESRDLLITSLKTINKLTQLSAISNNKLSAISKSQLTTNYEKDYLTNLNKYMEIFTVPLEGISFKPYILESSLALKQGINDKKLNEILSEGEQTVVALAHFISENLMLENDNVLIFDDPVNSLDIQRMCEVAEQLVQLSLKKQIIIFTHNLFFYCNLVSCCDKFNKQNYEKKFCYIEKNYEQGKCNTGVISQDIRDESYGCYIGMINQVKNKGKQTEQEVRTCYGWLRSALEKLIEDIIFKGAIKRYEPNMTVGSIEGINIEELTNCKTDLVKLYRKASRFMDGHSSSVQASIPVDYCEFIKDFNQLQAIRAKFPNK